MWFPSGDHVSPPPDGLKIWTHPVPWIVEFFLSVMGRDRGMLEMCLWRSGTRKLLGKAFLDRVVQLGENQTEKEKKKRGIKIFILPGMFAQNLSLSS